MNSHQMCGPEERDTQLNAPPTCHQCNKYIYDGTILRVRGHYWHNACLTCTACHVQVTDTCHVHNQDVYCRADFIRLFGTKCASCAKIVSPSEAARVVNGNAYHAACFSCVTCRKELQTGDYLYTRQDGKLMCYQDYKQTTTSDDSSPTDSESDESGSDESGRTRRACQSDAQLRMLAETYQSTKRPDRGQREHMSRATGLTQRDIQLWFRNRRRSERRAKANSVDQNKRDSGRLDTPHPLPQNTTQSPFPLQQQLQQQIQQQQQQQQQQHLPQLPVEEEMTSQFQLFCPLDYMSPGAMPPNIDLSTANLCNGEIVMPKRTGTGNGSGNKPVPEIRHPSHFFHDNMRQWLTVDPL